jgi:hypothetical protein
MCTDFTDLNKCKDDFPLGKIYQIVDSTGSFDVKALLDCFFGLPPDMAS